MKSRKGSSILNGVDGVLIADLKYASDSLKTCDSQFWRRTYCRCLMAMFEGIIQGIKDNTLEFSSGVLLGDDEEKLLKARLGALESAYCALDLSTSCAGAITPLQRDTQEWLVLKKAIRIRNRITHPRSTEDLNISIMDLQHLRVTEKVMLGLVVKALTVSAKALKESAQAIRRKAKEYKIC